MNNLSHKAALADVMPLIENLELPYLESLHQLLEGHIAARRAALIDEARAKVARIAHDLGMPVEQILMVGKPARHFDGAGRAKYRDPDSGKTWSGFGTVPRWIRGQDRDAFLIRDDSRAS